MTQFKCAYCGDPFQRKPSALNRSKTPTDLPESGAKPPEFIVWSQHWVGYKPRKVFTYQTFDDAKAAADRLNSSPSGEWYHYSVEARNAD